MHRIRLTKVVGWLAGAVGILALALSSVGTAAAEEDETLPKPTINTQNNPPFGSTPNCVAVTWAPPNAPPGETIAGYSVERDNPKYEKDVGGLLQHTVCGQEQNTPANFKVCALWVSEEEDPVTSCSLPTSLSTTKAEVGEMEKEGPLPTPKVDEPLQKSANNFGVGWKGFYDYDFYYVDVLPKGGEWNQIQHKDDGTWGWQRVEVTPGTTYSFRVRGCVTGIFGDPCSGWSPEATVTIDLPYGPDTCLPGFVWRDAVPGDHICVTPERRQKVADDLNTGNTRTQPRSGNPAIDLGTAGGVCPLKPQGEPISPECWEAMRTKCLDGFVARDIPGENVIVCVDQKEADLLKQENANRTANRVTP